MQYRPSKWLVYGVAGASTIGGAYLAYRYFMEPKKTSESLNGSSKTTVDSKVNSLVKDKKLLKRKNSSILPEHIISQKPKRISDNLLKSFIEKGRQNLIDGHFAKKKNYLRFTKIQALIRGGQVRKRYSEAIKEIREKLEQKKKTEEASYLTEEASYLGFFKKTTLDFFGKAQEFERQVNSSLLKMHDFALEVSTNIEGGVGLHNIVSGSTNPRKEKQD